MAAEIVVSVEGIPELQARLGRALSAAVLRGAMVRSTALVQERLNIYPPASHRKMIWASEKQRRYVMMAIRQGIIEVPYVRTMTLGRRWTTQVTGAGDDLTGIVGNNTSYGPYVMGRDQQAAYHAGTWPIAEDVAEKSTGDVLGIFQAAVQAGLG